MPAQLTVADISPGASDNFVGAGNGSLHSPSGSPPDGGGAGADVVLVGYVVVVAQVVVLVGYVVLVG